VEREPQTEPNVPQYIRINFLIAAAFIVVVACLFITIWVTVTDEFAKGIMTLVLGRFLGYVDNIYNYEFGTTRSAGKKDETIRALANPPGTTVTTPSITTTTPSTVVITPGPTQIDTKLGDK
jgi:hypothetical protein